MDFRWIEESQKIDVGLKLSIEIDKLHPISIIKMVSHHFSNGMSIVEIEFDR